MVKKLKNIPRKAKAFLRWFVITPGKLKTAWHWLKSLPRKVNALWRWILDTPQRIMAWLRSIRELFIASGEYGRNMVKHLGAALLAAAVPLFFAGKLYLVLAAFYGYVIGALYTLTLISRTREAEQVDITGDLGLLGIGAAIRLSLVIFGLGPVAYYDNPAFFAATIAFFAYLAYVFAFYVIYIFRTMKSDKRKEVSPSMESPFLKRR